MGDEFWVFNYGRYNSSYGFWVLGFGLWVIGRLVLGFLILRCGEKSEIDR